MYKLEIETNNTVKWIENPRKVKVVDLFFTTKVKVMDGNGMWTEIGHLFLYQDACHAAEKIRLAILSKRPFVKVYLN